MRIDEVKETQMVDTKSEVRDGMRIDWDVKIPADDGTLLAADVYRPDDDEPHPATA